MGSDRALLFGQRAVDRRLGENENGWVGPPPYELADDEMANRFTGLANKDPAEGTSFALYKRLHPQTQPDAMAMAEADEQRRWSAQELLPSEGRARQRCELPVFLRLAIAGAQRPDGLTTRSTSRSCSTTWTSERR
jgi:hypothetical protein